MFLIQTNAAPFIEVAPSYTDNNSHLLILISWDIV